MGFGYLLLGYLLQFTMRADTIRADEILNFVGYILLMIGLCKLAVYNRGFRMAKYVCAALLPLGFPVFLRQVGAILLIKGVNTPLAGFDTVHDVLTVIITVLLLIFHVFLLWGIADMAKEVELPKLRVAAVRNILISSLSYILLLLFRIDENIFGSISRYFDTPLLFLDFCRLLLCGICVFNCYRLICLPGDEDMPGRDTLFSRIANRKKNKEKPMTPEEKTAAEKAAYNETMRRRQEERTKKNKRGKSRR